MCSRVHICGSVTRHDTEGMYSDDLAREIASGGSLARRISRLSYCLHYLRIVRCIPTVPTGFADDRDIGGFIYFEMEGNGLVYGHCHCS